MEMYGNNWRAAQAQGGGGEGGGAAARAIDSGDWRTQLMPDSRQRIINKIMETLKMHLPVSGQEVEQELKKVAVRLEEKIYSAATSQQDYLQKISLKMLTMETKSQNPMTNSIQPNPASSGQNALGSGSHSMQSQLNSQAQQLPVPMVANQTQTRQPPSQQDYIREISLKMLTMHISKAQNTYAHQPPTMDSNERDIASEFHRLLCLTD